MKQENNLKTALHLASQGMAVFPCHSGGEKIKQPMPFIKWRDVSTTDMNKIRAWWLKWPQAAIGLDLAKSGLIVIDCDRHGEHDGVKAFGDLAEKYVWNPDSAPLVATPNDGMHVFFKQTNIERGNQRGALPVGIDVRGAGGYVIAPTTSMQDGRQYELTGNLLHAPEIPVWLAGILDAGKNEPAPADEQPIRGCQQDQRIAAYCETAIAEELERVKNAPKGARNNTLNQAAFSLGQLIGSGWISSADISANLMSAALSIGLDQTEARKTIQSGLRSGEKDPRKMPESNFPDIDQAEAEKINAALKLSLERKEREKNGGRLLKQQDDGTIIDADTGEIIDDKNDEDADIEEFRLDYPPGLVGEIARYSTQNGIVSQPELAILVGLSVVATAAGRQFCTPFKYGGISLYTLGLAPTGSGKEAILQTGKNILKAASLGFLIGAAKFHSASSIHNFLKKKPLSICYIDEFGQYFKEINHRRASSSLAAVPGVLRTIWGLHFNSTETSEGVSVISETVEAPSLSLFCVSTPQQFWDSLRDAALEDGTLNRFILINGRHGTEEDNLDDPKPVPDEIVDSVRNIYFYSDKLAAKQRNDPRVNPLSSGQMKKTKWCPDGSKKLWLEFRKKINNIIRENEKKDSFYGRTAEMALRIATIIAIGRLDDFQVRRNDVEYGIALAEKSAELMEAGAADYMAENEGQANAKKVLRIIKAQKGKIKHSDLYWSLKYAIKARDLKDILGYFIEAGQIERQEVKTKGRPSVFYLLKK